jgi:hypothetical protein
MKLVQSLFIFYGGRNQGVGKFSFFFGYTAYALNLELCLYLACPPYVSI